LVTLKFNREIILADVFNETTVDIYIQPADSKDTGDLNMTWEVDSITGEEILIKLFFSNIL